MMTSEVLNLFYFFFDRNQIGLQRITLFSDFHQAFFIRFAYLPVRIFSVEICTNVLVFPSSYHPFIALSIIV